MAVALICASYSQQSVAKEFTSSELLTWETKEQDWFFQISVTMAVFVTSKANPEQSKCINDWYFNSTSQKNDYMREKLEEYSSMHPTAIVMASMQEACGNFD